MKHAGTLAIPEALPEILAPPRAALPASGTRGDVPRQIQDAEAASARAQGALDAARSADVRVASLRHRSLPEAWTGVGRTHAAMRRRRTDDPEAVPPRSVLGSPGFENTPELEPRQDEPALDELSVPALGRTALPVALRRCDVVPVTPRGEAAEIGIDVTARHAADLGLLPMLIEDACGAGHAEAGARAVETLRLLGITVVTDAARCADALGVREPA